MSADADALRDAAGALARELERLRGRFAELAHDAGREWVERELAGYPAGTAVPRYRDVPCMVEGRFAGPDGAQEIAPLPTQHLSRGDRAPIREGVLHLEPLAAAAPLRRPIDAQRHALYLRGMPAPRAGWRLVEAWECVAIDGLLAMLEGIAAYGRAMHEDAVRRASAPPTSRRDGSRPRRR